MHKRCPRCLLSEKVPNTDLDTGGICRPCREFHTGRLEEQEAHRKRCEQDLEQALASCSGQGEYDCLVSFSGGKDSVFLLHKLVKEYGLKVLAYTSNFDIPQRTWTSSRIAIRPRKSWPSLRRRTQVISIHRIRPFIEVCRAAEQKNRPDPALSAAAGLGVIRAP